MSPAGLVISYGQSVPINLTRYTEQDGVPSSQIYNIMVDRFGMIWLGTINGLARFDGYNFTRFYYDPNDSTTIRGLNVWSIFEDSRGRIWVAAGPSHLNLYDPATKIFRHYKFDHLIDHQANVELGISSINEDSKGRIWFGITTNYNDPITDGLLYYDEENDSLLKYNELKTGNIFNSTTAPNGNIWWVSSKGLLTTKDSKVMTIDTPNEELAVNNEFFTDLQSDNKGKIWIVTNRISLYTYDPDKKQYTSYHHEDSTAITSGYANIAVDGQGDVWVGTNRGLEFFDRSKKKFSIVDKTVNDILTEATILELKFDQFGSLWIGTFSGGLFRYDERSLFKSIREPYITSGWVNNLYEEKSGRIWITTTGPGNSIGMNLLEPKTGKITIFPFSSILPGVHTVFGIMELTPHEFIISTNLGLYRFLPKTNKAYRYTLQGLPDSLPVYQFFTDHKKNLWLCTFNGLYRKKPKNENFERYDISSLSEANASSNEITNIIESRNNGLWLMTNNGLFRYDYSTDNIERHGFNPEKTDILISHDINALYEDKNGILWIGTWQGGLSRYDVKTGKIKTYTINDGLPSMSVQGILGDESNNHLWLSTFDGLSRFNLKTGQFNNFSIADGIQSQLFADGSILQTGEGLFVFGGSNGVTLFRPQEVRSNSSPPNVFISGIRIFNERLTPSKDGILKDAVYKTDLIKLPYFKNTITIEFSAIHYSNPAKNKTAYILENYDSHWHEVGNQQFAYYSKLPPGEYKFRVKAANNNGVWNEEGDSLSIIITPPWWKTIPAYLSYLIILGLLIYFADRYFRYRLIQKERKRNMERELQHAKEIEKAYAELKLTQNQLIQSEKMASLGELTAGIAHEIKNPLNFINNFSEVNAELIEELKNELHSGNNENAIAISEDIKLNEQKIAFHGKRADTIIRGMLQHCRNDRIKELTDLNAITDEYLRLSYHGMRARDKSFNVKIKTDFDEKVGKVSIVPDEIGRVILNLVTNAFYAVNQKKDQTGNGYEPVVSVSTRKMLKWVEISVADNGTGIPEEYVDKIFQPFYTTKPPGKGTGLGLSLSYEIVTKGHNGKLMAETTEGEGSRFIITLPA